MRTYDDLRHTWMYDIGGHAWNNTELMPDAWLWFSFLRTGRADVFRFAEAMTRNTSEVDVYHLGKFVGLGSRHNVSHWGCGAKEARISESFLKRFYYYLTTDERTGDLMRETLDVDRTVDRIQPLRKQVTRGSTPIIRVGPDWLAFASNWMTEWERTGDTRYRDYVLTGMKCIGAMPEKFVTLQAFRYDSNTKELFDIGEPNNKAGEFLDLFGGDQIVMDLITLIPCPEFEAAWNRLCTDWATNPKWKGYTKMRMCAYVANLKHDPALMAQAWDLLKASVDREGSPSNAICTGPHPTAGGCGTCRGMPRREHARDIPMGDQCDHHDGIRQGTRFKTGDVEGIALANMQSTKHASNRSLILALIGCLAVASPLLAADIPSLDEMAGDWMPLTIVTNFPDVHNFNQMVIVNRDLTSYFCNPGGLFSRGADPTIQWRAGYPLVKMTLDGVEYPATDVRWSAYRALRATGIARGYPSKPIRAW